ncbi:MAG: papain-like cysteine protease family protein [Acidobacteriota bacterium]
MKRREFLTSLAVLGAARFLPATPAIPAPTPGPSCLPDGTGGELCEARACTFLASVAPHAQEETNWCWAACLEMAFSCLNNRVTQENIVKATWGDIRNAPLSPANIVRIVNREYVNILGGHFRPKAKLLDRTFTIFTDMGAITETFDHVAAGKPAIVGTLNPDGTGHATMLTHLTVRRASRNTLPTLHSASVYDPWYARGNQPFTAEDWDRSPFIVLIGL